MQVKWLLEKDVFSENLDPLMAEIKKQGHDYKVTNYEPFESGTYDQFDDKDCVVCYGSLNLMRHLQKIKKWVPGPIMNLPNFECTKYYAYFGKYLLNKDYIMMPLAEMFRRKDELLSSFKGRFFVRPSTGFKSFTGQIVNWDKWEEDTEWIKEWGSQSEIVVVSSAKKIDAEYRFVVANKKVITGSQYKVNCELEVTPLTQCHSNKALRLAETIAAEEWEPDKAYTIDIGECDNEVHLVEINSLSGSGLYDCDLRLVVEAISEVSIKEWKETWE